MLVTNATMLEYMLVRNEDKPILDQSAGKLRWIVLDEAHTYLGSNAAEISLLLRRVMDSFQVEPNKVRFIATSATIGSGSSEKVVTELREFLADLAGISIVQVDVITGRRITPELEKTSATLSLPTLKELNTLSSFSDRYDRLRSVPEIQSLRHSLTAKALNLEQIAEQLEQKGSQADTFAILDACSEKPPEESDIKEALLPLRGHFFMRTQQGVWACWNKTCSGRTGELCDDSWRFGAVFLNPRKTCEHCNSLVFEVVTCNDCGEVLLVRP